MLTVLHEQIKALQGQVDAHFGRHPDAEIILSQPGLGSVLGARVLAEFGDDPDRYADAKRRKNYAGTSPITRASGKKTAVLARFVHNDRLIDALMTQAFSALRRGDRLVAPLREGSCLTFKLLGCLPGAKPLISGVRQNGPGQLDYPYVLGPS